jgi:heptosyltransferase-2
MRRISKILFISLSNIGDAILTLPAMDELLQEYPQADITVICGERPRELFEGHPRIKKVIVYNKRAGLKSDIRLFASLLKERFDLVVDLRNTFFGVALPSRRPSVAPVLRFRKPEHMRDKHLLKVKSQKSKVKSNVFPEALCISRADEEYVERFLKENSIAKDDRLVAIAPGARSHIKRWPKERFAQLSGLLASELGLKVVLVGDKSDTEISAYIAGTCGSPVLDLTGKTSLKQLAALLKRSRLLVTNDSAILHLASYLNIPVAALFGPTNERKYGPWSQRSVAVHKFIRCRPCEKASCGPGNLKCLDIIQVGDVLREIKELLEVPESGFSESGCSGFRRILIVRTDRMGDVLLSTPVIKALRMAYPRSYIAMMVGPNARDIVEGNPYLDEVIIFDKDVKHKGIALTIRFARRLAKKEFDLALILHPTNRVHLVTLLAGIPYRLGYNRKMGNLLTERIIHTKQDGERHEADYNLDLLRFLGIRTGDPKLYMSLKKEAQIWARDILEKAGVGSTDKLLAIHPAASCPSKIWPAERFARVADALAQRFGFKVLVLSGIRDIKIAESVINSMSSQAIDLAGRTTVAQLAAVLARCRLFISNDSGPVHIAAALGIPVISIFGRKQKGLSPQRWAPLGPRSRYIHRDAGCIECLAHNCVKGFSCLKSISVDDVLGVAESLLGAP